MVTASNTPTELVLTGPDDCVVKAIHTANPEWPVMLQVDGIAVELDRQDVAALRAWLGAVDTELPVIDFNRDGAGHPVDDDGVPINTGEVPC